MGILLPLDRWACRHCPRFQPQKQRKRRKFCHFLSSSLSSSSSLLLSQNIVCHLFHPFPVSLLSLSLSVQYVCKRLNFIATLSQDILAVGYGSLQLGNDAGGLLCCWSIKNPEVCCHIACALGAILTSSVHFCTHSTYPCRFPFAVSGAHLYDSLTRHINRLCH